MVEGAQMGYYSEFQEVTVILNGHNFEIEDAGQNVLKYRTDAGERYPVIFRKEKLNTKIFTSNNLN